MFGFRVVGRKIENVAFEFEFGPSVLLSAHTGRVNTNQGFSAPKHDLESHNPVQ